jgi:anthranilate phosphoribosyltransferase
MLTQTTWSPETFGLPNSKTEDLVVDGPAESAQAIRSILAGEKGPRRDIVVANVAATLWVSQWTHSLLDGVARAQHAIDSGNAAVILAKLAEHSHQSTPS